MNTRYVRKIKTDNNVSVFEAAHRFLRKKGFRCIDSSPCGDTYRKGTGFFGFPQFITVEASDKTAIITAWRKHALLPGVFAFDVHRRSRRLERNADSLAALITQNNPIAVTQKPEKNAVVSMILGALSGFTWLFPVIGLATSFAGIVTGIISMKDRKALATVGLALSSFFFTFSASQIVWQVFFR
ncbi:MAG TPA: hypothetical protein VHO66_05580 [Ruminiclostridium sp.]|nr:hypothetical protein [Ruminiclostridium sp.]